MSQAGSLNPAALGLGDVLRALHLFAADPERQTAAVAALGYTLKKEPAAAKTPTTALAAFAEALDPARSSASVEAEPAPALPPLPLWAVTAIGPGLPQADPDQPDTPLAADRALELGDCALVAELARARLPTRPQRQRRMARPGVIRLPWDRGDTMLPHRHNAQTVLRPPARHGALDVWTLRDLPDCAYGRFRLRPDGRAVFNLAGNKYRLVVRINSPYRVVDIRFIGSHAEYDRIDAQTI